MEFCEGQTLFDIIKTNNPVISRWDTLIRLLYDISRCMQFIHTRGVVHRDLKAENIMVRKLLSFVSQRELIVS